jgi:hypothetical protein
MGPGTGHTMSTVVTPAPFADIPPEMSPSDPDFISVLNDRLRRIHSTATVAMSSASSSGGTTRIIGSDGGQYDIPIVGGHAIIDPSRGRSGYLTLDQNCIIDLPINVGPGDTYRVYLDQNATGGWLITFASGYLYTSATDSNGNYVYRTKPKMRYILTFTYQADGNVNQPFGDTGPIQLI